MSKQNDCPGSTGEVLCAGEDDQPCMVFSRFKDGSPGRAWYATCATPEAARRVAACGGACEGVSTEILVAGARHDWGELMAEIEEQRDRLLAALNLIEVDKDGDGFICREAMEQVRDAIAAVEQPAAPAAPAPVTYSHDDGSGEFFVGSFPTPEDAAADALQETDAESVDVGENVKHQASRYVSGVWIIEDVAQRAYDECGDAAEDWLSGLARYEGEMADLERLVGDWIDRREPTTFGEVVNVRTITRAELVASGRLEADG
jgi:hypothetical protein